MTDDEIVERLAAAIPSANIYLTAEEQARELLPAVRSILAERINPASIATQICTPAELRAL